jgi:hypothetical protein
MINATVTGDTKVIELFDADKIPQMYYDGILAKVIDLTAEMQKIAQGMAPSKTGKLRASIDSDVKKGKDFIKGRVFSTDGAKAVATEYGATGRAKTAVKPYTMTLSHLWAKAIAPIQVQVPAHPRIQNIAPHPFMRPALQAISGKYAQAISEVMDEVTAKANAELAS